MMIGESLCFLAYFFLKYVVYRKDPSSFDANRKPVNPLIIFPVTILNWIVLRLV